VAIGIRIELRDLPRLKQLIWELRQTEQRLRDAGRPEADEIEHMLDRFLADISLDERSA
jgi:hypothetical protein